MTFDIQRELNTKIGHHQGIFTRSYQEARASYDAAIRNWKIEFKDPVFQVTNSDGYSEHVFCYQKVQNCSCSAFVENQCGTCMHIEAVKRIGKVDLKSCVVSANIQPFVFVDTLDFRLKKRGKGKENFFSPAVEPFVNIIKAREFKPHSITVNDYDVFTDYGISLFPFQKSSIQKMIENKRSVLTLKMGLGKTLCALACIKILEPATVIIVAPNNLRFQWQREINRFNLGSSLVISKGKDIESYSNQKFLIVGYEMLNRHPDLLAKSYSIAIIDEIQKIKNPESVTWATMAKIKSDFIFALSGTPIQNSISDLVSIIKILNPYEMTPEWRFYEEFCDFSRARMYGIRPNKSQELRAKFGRYIINPKIDEKVFSLPEKNDIRIGIKLTDQQLMLHDGFMSMAQPLMAKAVNYPLTFAEKAVLNGLLTKARLSAVDARLLDQPGSPPSAKSERLEKIEDTIWNVYSKGEKIIVFSEWIKTLSLLHEFLDTNGIRYVSFNGEISSKERDKNLVQFINDPTISVFLSTDSGGLGIDGLQHAARNIIHVEPLWNPMRLEQRNGRLVRALQKAKTVDVYHFCSDYGVEELIMNADSRKRNLVTEMFS